MIRTEFRSERKPTRKGVDSVKTDRRSPTRPNANTDGSRPSRKQSDEDRSDAGSEEGLQLIVDIRGESESASDEDGYQASGTSAHNGGCAGSERASVVL